MTTSLNSVSAAEKVIAVTIGVGEKHGFLANLAAESCRRQTGLPVHILDESALSRHNLAKPHHLKFRLFQEFRSAETILYFDADTIFLKTFDVSSFIDLPEFVCVRDVWDRNWIYEDAARVGIAPKEYFNSGFFIANRRHHSALLAKAEGLVGKIVSQYCDQTVLNAARAQLGIPAFYLSKYFNYLAFENCPDADQVTIGHLNGIHGRPHETVLRYYQFWRRHLLPDTTRRQRAIRDFIGRRFHYIRVGHDSRIMEFKEGGLVGRGGGRRERRWEISDDQNQLMLWLIGDHQPICGLAPDEKGVWTGRWMRFEQMPIEIRPLDSDSHLQPTTT